MWTVGILSIWWICFRKSIIIIIIDILWLSFLGAEPRYGTFYGEAVRPMIIADLSCSGTESDILSCERTVFGITHCQEYEAAGIKCLGMSQLYIMLCQTRCTS